MHLRITNLRIMQSRLVYSRIALFFAALALSVPAPAHASSPSALAILHSFGDGSVSSDGEKPQASLVQGSDGSFYGTTSTGGSAGEGTVFKITPTGMVAILHSFGDGTVTNDGQYPVAALIQGSDGNFMEQPKKAAITIQARCFG